MRRDVTGYSVADVQDMHRVSDAVVAVKVNRSSRIEA